MQPHLHLLVGDVDVVADGAENVALQPRQVVRLGAVLPLMGEDELKPVLGGLRGAARVGAAQESEEAHVALHSTRCKKLRRSGPSTRISICAPISRDTASA